MLMDRKSWETLKIGNKQKALLCWSVAKTKSYLLAPIFLRLQGVIEL